MSLMHATGVKTNEDAGVLRTTCCVVGGGPGGAVLALLLARKGVDVTLLEAHPDFDREFRGDTLHPSVMEIMDELGLADELLKLRHSKVETFSLQTASGPFTPVNLGRLKTRFPYITLMPQKSFLEFITKEAARHPNFRLVMGARCGSSSRKAGRSGGFATRAATERSTKSAPSSPSGRTGGARGCVASPASSP